MRSLVEGSNGHQKDWFDLDNLRDRGLQKARLHTALSMLSEAMVAYTRVQRRRQRVNQPGRSHINTNKNSKRKASLLADALLLKNGDETSLKIERH